MGSISRSDQIPDLILVKDFKGQSFLFWSSRFQTLQEKNTFLVLRILIIFKESVSLTTLPESLIPDPLGGEI